MSFPRTKNCDCGHYMTRLDELRHGEKIIAVFYFCSECRSSEWLGLDDDVKKNPEGNQKMEAFC